MHFNYMTALSCKI